MAELSPDLAARLSRPLRILAVGDELLRGDRPDTNSPWLAARLSALGWTPDRVTQVGDDPEVLAEQVRAWREEGGCLVVGGGLGPTVDDRSREAIAAGLGVDLVLHERAAAWIAERETRLERRFGEQTHRQAMLPASCEPVPNPQGTAPAFWSPPEDGAKGFILVLPGVPGEYRAICESVIPVGDAGPRSSNWILTGLGEDKLAGLLADLPGADALGFYPSFEGHRLRVPTDAVDESDLARRLSPYLVSRRGVAIEQVLVRRLAERGQTLSVAESCTGGLLGARISRVAGASQVWLGGVLSYADAVKSRLLGVPPELIAREGAVSEAVARAMAQGAREALGSDWALAVTGIAGPGGARPGKPVGTLHLALAGASTAGARHRHLRAGWDREHNRRYAVQQALTLLWRALEEA